MYGTSKEGMEGSNTYWRRIRLLALVVAVVEIVGLIWNSNSRANVANSPRMLTDNALLIAAGPYNALPADPAPSTVPAAEVDGPVTMMMAMAMTTMTTTTTTTTTTLVPSALAPESDAYLEELLRSAAGADNTIILTAGNSEYVLSIMSLACNLKELNLERKLVVAALDQIAFEKLQAAGVASYLETFHEKAYDNLKGGKYNTKAFRDITKLKSKAALRILSMGFDVLWSDSDIAWFRDPLPYLRNEMVLHGAHIAIQSNAPDAERSNEQFRINSGFYLARATPFTQTAFEAIVADAKASALSEQPSFYRTLCGPSGEFRSGINACKAPVPSLIHQIQEHSPPPGSQQQPDDDADSPPTWEQIPQPWEVQKVITRLLPRKLFSSGTTGAKSKHSPQTGIWALPSRAEILAEWPGIYILHNNWIEGLDRKVQRAKAKGLWYVQDGEGDDDGRLKCAVVAKE